ncbi:MAG: hypothetical protein HY582_00655 [Candidatus Omnitrophica bacterium]|nr:hypothetical protein [Candidatus Omnitrophota bacterium]
MKHLKRIITILFALVFLFVVGKGVFWIAKRIEERHVLKKVIGRLSADSRIAEVLVTKSIFNEQTKSVETTIKFLEYDAENKPLQPRYFTFHGNIIQFQSLVIRFEDKLVEAGDKLRGKSAYLFLKVFMLDGANTQVYNLAETSGVPEGYKVSGVKNEFEQKLWEEFWKYALDPKAREHSGIKNAQIEAPGSMFLPGSIYTIRIEHDGGMRIDASPLPEVLKGEQL